MASNYRTDIFLKKLYYIHEQCASARKKKEEEDAEANMDDFTRLRKKIATDIRDAKVVRANYKNVYHFAIFHYNRTMRESFKATKGDSCEITQEPVNLSLHAFSKQFLCSNARE